MEGRGVVSSYEKKKYKIESDHHSYRCITGNNSEIISLLYIGEGTRERCFIPKRNQVFSA